MEIENDVTMDTSAVQETPETNTMEQTAADTAETTPAVDTEAAISDARGETPVLSENPLSDDLAGQIGMEVAGKDEFVSELQKMLPDDLKDKGWAKKYATPQEALKAHDSLLKKFNERPESIDFTTATEDQLDKHFSNFVNDETVYEFDDVVDDGHKEQFSEVFKAGNLHPRQAAQVGAAYDKLATEINAKLFSEDTFNEKAESLMGGNFTQSIETVDNMMIESIGAPAAAYIQKLPSNEKASVYAVINKIAQEYGADEGGISNNDVEGGVDWDRQVDTLRAQSIALTKTPGHTTQQANELQAKYRHAVDMKYKTKGNK